MIKIDISAITLTEAIEIARLDHGLYVTKNVTQLYKKEGCPTGNELRVFMVNMMRRQQLGDLPGAACILVLEPGSKTILKAPYVYKSYQTKGLKFRRHYILYAEDTPNLALAKILSKNDAVKKSKHLCAKYKKNIAARVEYLCVSSERPAFTMTYHIGENNFYGSYVVFGNPPINKNQL